MQSFLGMVAYDYDNQKWVTGAAAIDLRRKQLLEELDLLTSACGFEYAEFLGQDRDLLIRLASDEFARL